MKHNLLILIWSLLINESWNPFNITLKSPSPNSIFHFQPKYLLPLPNQSLILNYEKADSTKIRKALDSVNWERFFDKKDFNAQVKALNKTIFNVFGNNIPNKHITVDDKDSVWKNEL